MPPPRGANRARSPLARLLSVPPSPPKGEFCAEGPAGGPPAAARRPPRPAPPAEASGETVPHVPPPRGANRARSPLSGLLPVPPSPSKGVFIEEGPAGGSAEAARRAAPPRCPPPFLLVPPSLLARLRRTRDTTTQLRARKAGHAMPPCDQQSGSTRRCACVALGGIGTPCSGDPPPTPRGALFSPWYPPNRSPLGRTLASLPLFPALHTVTHIARRIANREAAHAVAVARSCPPPPRSSQTLTPSPFKPAGAAPWLRRRLLTPD